MSTILTPQRGTLYRRDEWLNSTWPHPGHSLVNLGEAGGSLVSALTTCPSTYLNFDVDLALVDLQLSASNPERLRHDLRAIS